MLSINEAYAIILDSLDGSTLETCDDIFTNIFGSFTFRAERQPMPSREVQVHPHHIDQRYRFLWHTINQIYQCNQGLAIRCWERIFFGKYIFRDIRVSWSMLLAYYFNGCYQTLLNNVENGLIWVSPIGSQEKATDTIEKKNLMMHNTGEVTINEDNYKGIEMSLPVYKKEIMKKDIFQRRTRSVYTKEENSSSFWI